jgi:cbb3-type cytochrome oxidase subunit 3
MRDSIELPPKLVNAPNITIIDHSSSLNCTAFNQYENFTTPNTNAHISVTSCTNSSISHTSIHNPHSPPEIIAAIVVPVLLLLISAATIWWLYLRRRNRKRKEKAEMGTLQAQLQELVQPMALLNEVREEFTPPSTGVSREQVWDAREWVQKEKARMLEMVTIEKNERKLGVSERDLEAVETARRKSP